jgi:hypothetical protein
MNNSGKILRSWKEIASYLGVGIRTAQRWTRRGLPVRRPGSSRTAVLGFADDIDRWLRTFKDHALDELEGVVATGLLTTRPARPRQLERELDAFLAIACLIARQDQNAVLRSISMFALGQCKAESAGFSILEQAHSDQEIFRWTATCGRMEQFEGGTTPANFSPCGVCLERNAPQLFRSPERFYAYLEPIAPIAELLLIPMHDGNAWLGTIWIISHTGRRKFDGEDARLMRSLGELASATLSATTRGAASTLSRPARKSSNRRRRHKAV